MIQEIARLFKRGKNSIMEWNVSIEHRDKKVNIFMSYGIYDMQLAIKYQNNIKGKNIGKANETNSWEQAQLEAESKVNLKKKEGYKTLEELQLLNQEFFASSPDLKTFLDVVLPEYNTDINGNEIPMKCQQYYRSSKNWTAPNGKVYDDRKYYYLQNPYEPKEKNAIIIEFPCIIQPKVNGVRAFVKLVNNEVKLYSKKGLEYNVPQVTEWFENNKHIFDVSDTDVIFDGELYIPHKSLQTISSAVKAYQLETLNVMYYIFDVAVENVPQRERYKNILYTETIKNAIDKTLDAPVYLVPARTVKDDATTQALTDAFIVEGYEGSILRDLNGLYEFGKRPKTITKLKRTMSNEYRIIDVIPAEKDSSIGLYVCVTEEGKEFKVNPKATEEEKREILFSSSSFIGKQLTCVFYEYTDDGLPFHIIDNIVRDYE